MKMFLRLMDIRALIKQVVIGCIPIRAYLVKIATLKLSLFVGIAHQFPV